MKRPTHFRFDSASPLRRALASSCAALLVSFATIQPSSAATLSWDPASSNGTALGGDGIWDLSDTDRWFDSILAANVDWANGNDAVFAGAGGTVSVGAAVAPTSLKFDSNYALNGSAITTGTINVLNGRTTTISNVISGLGGLTIGGTAGNDGTLILSGASDYAGITTITRGILKLGAHDALPTGTTISSSSNPTSIFDLNGFNQTVVNISGATQSTITNTSATRATLTLSGGAITASSQVLTGNLNVTKTGTGTWAPNSDNTFTGLLTISNGAIQPSRNALLGAVGQATMRLDGTGILLLNGQAFSPSAYFARDIELVGTGTRIQSNSIRFNGITGVISGTGDLVNTGQSQGNLVLAGNNTYSGLTKGGNRGTAVVAAHDNAFGLSPTISQSTQSVIAFQKTVTNRNINIGAASDIVLSQGIDPTSGAGLGTIHNYNGDNSFGGDITLSTTTAAFTADPGSSLLLKGVVSGANPFLKHHAGTIALSGANTYTGLTTVNDGTLRLDFNQAGAPASNIINSVTTSSALILGGGTVDLKGRSGVTANSQAFNGLTVNTGASTLSVNQNANLGGVNVTLGGIARTVAGGTINFILPAIGTVSTTALDTNGILGGYATVGGGDWATVATGSVSALSAYTDDTWGGTTNTTVTTSSAPGTDVTTNSLRFDAASSNGIALAGTNNVIASGGVLVTADVGANASNISGGTLRGAAGRDLVVIQNNSAGALEIGSQISDNTTATGLTKSGPGTLTLSSASNDYTGNTTVAEGVLGMGNATAIPATSLLVLRGGVVGLAADFTRALGSAAGNVQFTGNGGFAAYGADRNVNIGGAAASLPWGSATAPNTFFLRTGSALLLSAPDATHTVNFLNLVNTNAPATATFREIRVANGGAAIDARMSAVISGDGSLMKTGAGTLELSAANIYNGATEVNEGTLLLGIASALDTDSGLFVNNGSTARFNANTVSGGNFMTVTSGAIEAANGINVQVKNLTLGGGPAGTTSTVSTGTGTLILSGNVDYSGDFNNANGATISGNLALTTSADATARTRTFTIGDSSNAIDDLAILAPIANGGTANSAVIKAGNGTLNLLGANTYGGTTTVSGGTLLLSGSLSGTTGNVTAQTGGTFGGTGTLARNVTINSGSSLLGGNGTTPADDLSLGGNVTLSNNSVVRLTLGTAGAHSSLTRTAGTWVFDSDQAFSFIDAGATPGVYNNIIAGLATDPDTTLWNVQNSGWVGSFAYDGSNVDFTLVAIPEPASAAMLLGGFACLIGLQRRRTFPRHN